MKKRIETKKSLAAAFGLAAFAATLAANGLGAAESCITKVGETDVSSSSLEEVASRLESVSTANTATGASVSATLEGGVAAAASSATAPLEGGSVVSDESDATDCDFTPGGGVFIVR